MNPIEGDQEAFHFAPHDVAGLTNVSVQSVRRWAEYHSSHLSSTANPAPGQPRRFTWADIETFRRIKELRDIGLSVEAINLKLSEDKAVVAIKNPTTAVSVMAAQDAPGTPDSTQVLIVAQEAILRRLEAVEASRWNGVIAYAWGVLTAALFFLIIVLLLRPG